ncbi:MAG: hypothetical protein WBX01_04390 [Nitrososphaeraceae archaeon]
MNLGCQNFASQIQGDEKAVEMAAEQSFVDQIATHTATKTFRSPSSH